MSAPPAPSVPRRLFSLAAPVIGLNMLSVLTLAVDTAMCGRLANADTVLAALGFATQIVFLLMILMMGLTVGTVALVARAYGAGEHGRLNHLLVQSSQLCAITGVVVAGLGNLLAEPLLLLLGAEPASLGAGLDYLRPLLTFTVFYYLNILYGAVFRGVGNTRLPFVIALVVNVCNIGLDYALILGNFGLPALGVSGAAYGTVISYALGAVLYAIVLRRNNAAGLRLPLRVEPIDRAHAAQLFRVGAPAALDMLILNVSFFSIIGMLGRIDEIAVAAHGVGLRVQALAFVPGLGVSQATGAMVGQALGGRDVGEARHVARASVVLCLIIMSTLALAIVLAAYPIVSVFDVQAGTPLAGYTVQWMRLLGYTMPLAGVHIAFVGVLQGAGATNTSLAINFITTVLIQVPLSWLLGFPLGLGAFGVWLSFPLSFIAKAALSLGAYRLGRWAKVGLHA